MWVSPVIQIFFHTKIATPIIVACVNHGDIFGVQADCPSRMITNEIATLFSSDSPRKVSAYILQQRVVLDGMYWRRIRAGPATSPRKQQYRSVGLKFWSSDLKFRHVIRYNLIKKSIFGSKKKQNFSASFPRFCHPRKYFDGPKVAETYIFCRDPAIRFW